MSWRALARTAAALVLLFWATDGAEAQRKYLGGVVDYARILSPGEAAQLQAAASSLAPRIETDLFVITVNDREPHWVALRAHRYMVEKAFNDLEDARIRHFGTHQKLTVLVLFRSSVVLHLMTNLEALDQTLLLNNFYSGLRTTEIKIRRSDETHAAAALRYLSAFGAATQSGLPSQLRDARLWITDAAALHFSRALWKTYEYAPIIGPWFGAWYTHVLLRATDVATTNLPLPGFAGFLAFCVGLHAFTLIFIALTVWAFKAMFPVLEHVGGASYVKKAIETLFMFPVLALVFAVANYDVENMLFLSQAFGTDLARYLDWARGIWVHNIDIGWPAIAAATVVVAVLEGWCAWHIHTPEILRYADSNKVDPRRPLAWLFRLLHSIRMFFKIVGLGVRFLVRIVWTATLGIFTGLVALYFIAWGVGRPLLTIVKASRDRRPVPQGRRSAVRA